MMYSQQNVMMQQHQMMQQQQLMMQQQQQQRRPTVAEPVVVVPFNIPTKLNNTKTSTPLLRPQEPGGSLPIDYEPTKLDVCSGRGKRNWNHSGNAAFRDLIQHSTPAYMSASTKNEKTTIVCNIVEEMRALGCKFLKEDSKTRCWYDIGDAQAREKVGHSLRDQVTAHNRSHATTMPNTEAQRPTHHRTVSDSLNEADSRRMSLDTTVLFGQFARRPSWIAQSENDTLQDAATSSLGAAATISRDINVAYSPPLLPQLKKIDGSNDRYNDRASFVNYNGPTNLTAATIVNPAPGISIVTPATSQPASTAPLVSLLSYEARRQAYPIINENTVFDPISNTINNDNNLDKEFEPTSRRRNTRESITMTEIQSWDPKSVDNSPQVTESMLQESVQSWDPRLSNSTTSMMSVRRSHIMGISGSTTLRRLTNNFRTSEISMQSIQSFMDGMDFDDDDDDFYSNNFREDVFATKNPNDDTTTTTTR